MWKPILLTTLFGTGAAGLVAVLGAWTGSSPASEATSGSKLCVVWSSADPGVAKNVCFMYTLNAKKAGWFDEVRLVIWGPSARLLAEDESLQAEVKKMQAVGVVVEACIACANNYGVAAELRALNIDVQPMGVPLSDRLKGDWKTLTF